MSGFGFRWGPQGLEEAQYTNEHANDHRSYVNVALLGRGCYAPAQPRETGRRHGGGVEDPCAPAAMDGKGNELRHSWRGRALWAEQRVCASSCLATGSIVCMACPGDAAESSGGPGQRVPLSCKDGGHTCEKAP